MLPLVDKLVITRSKSTAALKSHEVLGGDEFKKQRSVSPMPTLSRKESTGFTHADTLGETKTKPHPWKTEVAKFQLQKRVSELIGTFDKSDLREGETPEELKVRRRGSLQIESSTDLDHLPDNSTDSKSNNNNSCKTLKLLRRKSTSAILSNPEMNILNLTDILMESSAAVAAAEAAAAVIQETETTAKAVTAEAEKENIDVSTAAAPVVKEKEEAKKVTMPDRIRSPSMKRSSSNKAKNWEYFEIDDHPKAISDKKLQQLKAKYQRRKTESSVLTLKDPPIKEEEDEKSTSEVVDTPRNTRVPMRSNSVPIVEGINASKLRSKALKLSIDPLTGECLEAEEEEQVAVAEDKEEQQPLVIIRKVSTDSTSSADDSSSGCSSASRKSSRSSRRRSSLLTDIQEQTIPDEKVLEVRIDPLTGRVETMEVSKPPKKPSATHSSNGEQHQKKLTSQLSVDVLAAATAAAVTEGKLTADDDGIGSLPHTPTDFGNGINMMPNGPRLDDGIFTSSEEVLESILPSCSKTSPWADNSTSTAAVSKSESAGINEAEQITSNASTSTANNNNITFSKAMEKFKSGASESPQGGSQEAQEPEKVK